MGKVRRGLFGARKNGIQVSPQVETALGDTFAHGELESMSKFGTVIEVPAGRSLTVESRFGAEAFVVVAGTLAVRRGDEAVANLGAGDIVGEGSLITGERRNADVVAETEASIFVFSRREFGSLLTSCPQLDTRVRQLAAARCG